MPHFAELAIWGQNRMLDSSDAAARPRWWRRWNWWKIGFFTLLFACEFMREIIVLRANSKPNFATMPNVARFADMTVAKGQWTRIDRGEELIPGSVLIQCRRRTGECLEANVHVNDGWISEPSVDLYPATFTDDAVTYENNDPLCAHYKVRIDMKLNKVLAVRETTGDKSKLCEGLEQRIEMTLGSGIPANPQPFKGHFVPLVEGFLTILKALPSI